MITILHPSNETRRTVLAACQAGNTVIGWTLQGNAGLFYNPNAVSNQTSTVCDVLAVLESIGGDALLVRGNCGISGLQGIEVSTINGMESDDYVTEQLIGQTKFITSPMVLG